MVCDYAHGSMLEEVFNQRLGKGTFLMTVYTDDYIPAKGPLIHM
jgi:hypothetical protein